MKDKGFVRAISWCLIAVAAFAAAVAARADTTDDYIQAQMQAQHIPGLSLAVVRDGKAVKMKGYGLANVELRVPVTQDTAFEICSVTKQFVAAGIMLLVQDDKVNLDDPISLYIDGTPESWRAITIRQLLTMTSGIKDYVNDPLTPGGKSLDETRDFPREDTSADEIVRSIMTLPLNFAPGTKFSYSNTGYIILAMIIGKVSSEPWDRFLADRIFKPLGMTATRRDGDRDIVPNRASPYDNTGDIVSPELRNSGYQNPTYWWNGGGGILSTASDMTKWDAALRDGRILTPQSLVLMRTPTLQSSALAPEMMHDGNISDYGFAWFLDPYHGHTRMWHDGGGDGRSCNFTRFDDGKISVIVLANMRADLDVIANTVAAYYEPELAYPTFLFNASASQPTASHPPVKISVTIKNWSIRTADALVSLNIRSAPFGQSDIIGKQNSLPLSLKAGQSKTIDFAWTPPAAGEYRVYLGAFSPDWKNLYTWKNTAAVIEVPATAIKAP